MATPRKRWFRVADDVLSWDLDDRQTATAIRLMAWLNRRRSRNGLGPDEACAVTLTDHDLKAITRISQRKHAVRSLLALSELGAFSELAISEVEARSKLASSSPTARVQISWPKLAEFQGWPPEDRPRIAPSDSGHRTPSPTPKEEPPVVPQAEEALEGKKKPEKHTPSIGALWGYVQDAFAAYGPKPRALSESRERMLRQVVAKFGPTAPVEAVHGFIACHQHPGDGFDPLAHLKPETVYRPSNIAKYLDAYAAATDAGEIPPFPLPGTNAPPVRDPQRERYEQRKRADAEAAALAAHRLIAKYDPGALEREGGRVLSLIPGEK